jgi:hypothetical protein
VSGDDIAWGAKAVVVGLYGTDRTDVNVDRTACTITVTKHTKHGDVHVSLAETADHHVTGRLTGPFAGDTFTGRTKDAHVLLDPEDGQDDPPKCTNRDVSITGKRLRDL